MDLKLLWVQHAVHELGLKVYKVAGPQNRSNIGTKVLGPTQLLQERALAGLVSRNGIVEPVPSVYAVEQCDAAGDHQKEVGELIRLMSATSAVLSRLVA